MKITKKNFVILALFFITIFCQLNIMYLAPAHARESELWEKQIGRDEIGYAFDESRTRPASLQDVIINIVQLFLSFLALLFVIYTIWAGYKWMTAAGNEDRVKEAKHQLKSAIIGFVIIVLSYAITLAITKFIRDDIFDKL